MVRALLDMVHERTVWLFRARTYYGAARAWSLLRRAPKWRWGKRLFRSGENAAVRHVTCVWGRV